MHETGDLFTERPGEADRIQSADAEVWGALADSQEPPEVAQAAIAAGLGEGDALPAHVVLDEEDWKPVQAARPSDAAPDAESEQAPQTDTGGDGGDKFPPELPQTGGEGDDRHGDEENHAEHEPTADQVRGTITETVEFWARQTRSEPLENEMVTPDTADSFRETVRNLVGTARAQSGEADPDYPEVVVAELTAPDGAQLTLTAHCIEDPSNPEGSAAETEGTARLELHLKLGDSVDTYLGENEMADAHYALVQLGDKIVKVTGEEPEDGTYWVDGARMTKAWDAEVLDLLDLVEVIQSPDQVDEVMTEEIEYAAEPEVAPPYNFVGREGTIPEVQHSMEDWLEREPRYPIVEAEITSDYEPVVAAVQEELLAFAEDKLGLDITPRLAEGHEQVHIFSANDADSVRNRLGDVNATTTLGGHQYIIESNDPSQTVGRITGEAVRAALVGKAIKPHLVRDDGKLIVRHDQSEIHFGYADARTGEYRGLTGALAELTTVEVLRTLAERPDLDGLDLNNHTVRGAQLARTLDTILSQAPAEEAEQIYRTLQKGMATNDPDALDALVPLIGQEGLIWLAGANDDSPSGIAQAVRALRLPEEEDILATDFVQPSELLRWLPREPR